MYRSDLEFVSEFVYLGSLLSDHGGSENDIRRRIQIAKGAMTKLTRIWQNRKVFDTTKKRLVQTLVVSIFLYGSEAWTVRAAERKKKMPSKCGWCWRRMLRIPRTAKRTNISILEQLRISTRLSTLCYKNILSYFGRIARRLPINMDK
ncbi:jg4791 [Pararge aegeria aegeria]|uniref:Jg4791 protein n=1 Tax=Pararge aegeria aegeria TaxID=348720 RepID=A0A8S4RF26_9NEOP|nr:jg4791 [Pararge aegeria aegeria]